MGYSAPRSLACARNSSDRHARILARITSVDQVLACRPQLVGVKPALEVVPGMRPDLILHAAPPTSWDELSPLLRSSLTAAAEFEGLSPREAELGAAQDFGSMAGGAGAITASTPV